MTVVADTSPLNYLILLGYDRVLPDLYGDLYVPMAVMRELSDPLAPIVVATWVSALPDWVILAQTSLSSDPELQFLGEGERQALQFAEENQVDLILIDERKGSNEARKRGMETTGTLGVLLSAGVEGLLQPESAYKRLITETNFRTSANLEKQFFLDPRFF